MSRLQIGTFLHNGTYKILQVLGQGSFGITYLAEHANLGKQVAIKEFFMKELNSRSEDGSITGMSDGSLSQNYCQKFQKEAINLCHLDHPNIVRVTDSFAENGTFYYVMDYIEGQNLNDYIKQHHVNESEAVEIIKGVADALIYMHEKHHMLHLDLKPGNIMRRDSDGHIFLIDFGLSKHYSNDGQPETSTTIGLGTPGYAPIEQANQAKNGEFRPTIDVYSLGATLYKLLTRETPPPASELVTDEEVLAETLKGKSISQDLIDLVTNAMLPNVKKRIQSVSAFKEMLLNHHTFSEPNGLAENIEVTVIQSNNEPEVDAQNEETEFAGTSQKEEKHPDFEESSYILDFQYSNYPIITKHKAENGDIDAVIAYGIMALRGIGVEQDSNIAYTWFDLAKKSGDYRGKKIVEQWYILKDKYKKKDSSTSVSQHPSEGTNKNRNKLIIGAIAIIAFVFVIYAATKGGGNNVAQDDQTYYTAADTVDTTAVDTAEYIAPDNIIEVAHKAKGGWRHSGSVITNYKEDSGLAVCRSKIDKNAACKNGCLIGSGKGVVVVGKNSYACEGIPNTIKNILEQYKRNGSRINDIAITPSGKYVIIEENNGYSNSTGLPELDKELNRANSARENIRSVSLSDNGSWAVISDQHYTSAGYFQEIEYARKKYGEVYSVSMTNKGVIICCHKGVYYKNIPKVVSDNLSQLYWIPKYIKFTDGGLLLATDGKSTYWYYM